ncbi:Flavonoid 3'-monooxygenase [Apostasia shenzhenica]|uniref:Flavonoid 3'-monooxygenase n=1 Tax=Apostasia shenzhenica TaxID=1088818 RepID=A0A2I0AF51_9ASPA|nr:Flavonoid 3'-monooxygenase [Apostasia shenzhenica]
MTYDSGKEAFTVALAAFIVFIALFQRLKGKDRRRLSPGPRGLPLLGSLPFVDRNLHHYFTSLASKFGPVFSIRLGSKLCVVVSSPAAAGEIFRDQDVAFANHVVPAAARFYLGNSTDLLWAPYGPLWRMLRKIAVREILGVTGMKAVEPLRREEIRRMVAALEAQATEGSAVNVRNVADFFPAVAPLDPQGLGRRLRRLMEWLDGYLDGIFERRRAAMASGEKHSDVLEVLMELVQSGGPHESAFTSNLQDIIGASTDTTSTAVEWAMAELLCDQERMKEAHRELDAVVGKDRFVRESDIPQLRYLSAVVKETLRLHPPIPLLVPHRPTSDCTVAGFSVPTGTTVMINA